MVVVVRNRLNIYLLWWKTSHNLMNFRAWLTRIEQVCWDRSQNLTTLQNNKNEKLAFIPQKIQTRLDRRSHSKTYWTRQIIKIIPVQRRDSTVTLNLKTTRKSKNLIKWVNSKMIDKLTKVNRCCKKVKKKKRWNWQNAKKKKNLFCKYKCWWPK